MISRALRQGPSIKVKVQELNMEGIWRFSSAWFTKVRPCKFWFSAIVLSSKLVAAVLGAADIQDLCTQHHMDGPAAQGHSQYFFLHFGKILMIP